MELATRMSRLGTETAFEVLARAKALEAEGRNIVHLEIGEPDFDTPRHIVDAGVEAMRTGWTHYGPSLGLPGLRDAIVEHVNRTRGIETNPAQVVVTPGAKPIMFFALLALVGPGDEVVYPDPGFPIYVFPNVTGTGIPAKELSVRLLEEAGVACLAGTAFGAGGEGYVRFSYANSIDNIREALRRFEALLG